MKQSQRLFTVFIQQFFSQQFRGRGSKESETKIFTGSKWLAIYYCYFKVINMAVRVLAILNNLKSGVLMGNFNGLGKGGINDLLFKH